MATKSQTYENTLKYLSDLLCIAYIIGADNSHRTGHYYRFVIGRRPHLGILSGENMVTIDLLSSTYSGKNKRAGEIA